MREAGALWTPIRTMLCHVIGFVCAGRGGGEGVAAKDGEVARGCEIKDVKSAVFEGLMLEVGETATNARAAEDRLIIRT